MTDARYGDVLLYLRSTGIEAMRSYYNNPYSALHDRRIPDHFNNLYAKNKEELDSTSLSEKLGKFGCGYSSSYLKDARSFSTPYGRPPYYRHSDIGKPASKDPACCPSNPRASDVPLSPISPRRSSHQRPCATTPPQQYSHPYKRTSVSPPRPGMPEHCDNRSSFLDGRYKQSPYKSDGGESYHGAYHHRQHHHNEDKSPPSPQYHHHNHHNHFNSSPVATCRLPCCQKSDVADTRHHFESHRDASPPIPSSPAALKSMDYPSRDGGESSAFSPIRPSHGRRLHSTESGYSSESGPTSRSSACSTKDMEVCTKPCCHGSTQLSPGKPPHHDFPLPSNHHRQTANERKPNDTRYAHVHRRYSVDEHHSYYADRKYYRGENEKDQFESRSEMNLNDDFRQRRISDSHYHENVKELFGDYRPKPREQYSGFENHREPSESRLKSDISHWTPGGVESDRAEARRQLHKPAEDGEEASRTAMKAFDAHIRKMMTNTRDANSINYLQKFHSSIQPGTVRRSLSISSDIGRTRSPQSNENRRCLSTSSEPLPDIRVSPKADYYKQSVIENKHSVTQILAGKEPTTEKGNRKKDENQIEKENEKEKENHAKDLQDSQISPDTKIKEEDAMEISQKCDSTESKEKEEIKTSMEDDEEEKENKDISPVKVTTDDTTTSPSAEVQCPAVDSTLSDEAVASPNEETGGGLLSLTKVANEHLGQALAKEKKRSKSKFPFS